MSSLLSKKALLTAKEFSSRTGLTFAFVDKLVAFGELRSVRLGRRRFIPVAEVERFNWRFPPRDQPLSDVIKPVLRKRVRR
jgi:excisionase family DNA binding protein